VIDQDPRSIGARIVRARLALGDTQDQFAERVGVSYRTIQQWEQGRSKPSLDMLRMLAQKLRPSFTADYLLGIDDSTPVGEPAKLPPRESPAPQGASA
jgi:transcriptional regulator with XRE-family HTH domain